MAEPTSNSLPALIPPKTALKPSNIAHSQGTVKKRASKKRNRKIASCTNCRSRKVRCDKGQTCSHCKTKGLQCVYIENPSDLDKAPTRVVKKRNRRVKVCLNCRQRKIPCNQRTPCHSCEDGNLHCTYQPFSEADILPHDQEQASKGSVSNDDDLERGANEETDSAVRELSPGLVFSGQPEEAAYGRQSKQSSVKDYSAMEFYGYATSQNQSQHRHQYAHGILNRLPEPRYHHQDHPAYGYSGGEPQVHHFGRNDQSEGYARGAAGAAQYRSQQYLPLMGADLHSQQRVPYNYSLLPPSLRTPVYPQPIRNHPQPLYSPRQFLHDPTFQHQRPPNSASGPCENHEQPKPDVSILESATKDPVSKEDRPLSSDNSRPAAINRPPFQPNTVPHHPQPGTGLTLKKA